MDSLISYIRYICDLDQLLLPAIQADAKKGGEYTRIRLQFDDADTAPEPQWDVLFLWSFAQCSWWDPYPTSHH